MKPKAVGPSETLVHRVTLEVLTKVSEEPIVSEDV
jgi:hypothetical protein